MRRRWLILLAMLVGLARAGWAEEGSETMVPPSQVSNAGAAPDCPLPLTEEQIRQQLTSEQYRILRENGTEAPFLNAYWNNKKPGVYVDPLSGEPLFLSLDKFDSKTGWPSFTAPIAASNVLTRPDNGFFS